MKTTQTLFDPPIIMGAEISDCGKYRYKLWRIWNPKLPMALFVMLNPSKADASEDDPTIRRCIAFAKRSACGGIYVGNVYPYRATDPKELKKVGFDVATRIENWDHIREMAHKCGIKILAHGNSPIKLTNIRVMYDDWYCFGYTQNGHPKHPLFLRSDTPLIRIPHP